MQVSDNNMDEDNLIRRSLDGMWVDLHGRCSIVTYTILDDLVEKYIVQDLLNDVVI